MGFRKTLLLALGVVASALTTSAAAQAYPGKPVKIIVPFAAGGPADNYARSTTGPAPAPSLAPTSWPRRRPMATRC
jgi:hypothetical protein